MDNNVGNTVLSWVAIVMSLGSIAMGVVNHRRIRSNCCGRQASVSLDIDNTTPPRLSDPTENKVSGVKENVVTL